MELGTREMEDIKRKIEEANRNHQHVLQQQTILETKLKSSEEELQASISEKNALYTQLQETLPLADTLAQDYESRLKEKDELMAEMKHNYMARIAELEKENQRLLAENAKLEKNYSETTKLVKKYEKKVNKLVGELEVQQKKMVIQEKIYANQVFNALKKANVSQASIEGLKRLVENKDQVGDLKVQNFKMLFESAQDPVDAAANFLLTYPELRQKSRSCSIM